MTEKKKNKNEDINRRVIWLAGFTLFTALVWVALHSYHELARKDRMEDVEQLLIPLSSELKEGVLDKIRERKEYQLEEVEEFLKIEPTAIPTLSEIKGEVPVATETPEATESGGLNE
jgi:hypothetical protein